MEWAMKLRSRPARVGSHSSRLGVPFSNFSEISLPCFGPPLSFVPAPFMDSELRAGRHPTTTFAGFERHWFFGISEVPREAEER